MVNVQPARFVDDSLNGAVPDTELTGEFAYPRAPAFVVQTEDCSSRLVGDRGCASSLPVLGLVPQPIGYRMVRLLSHGGDLEIVQSVVRLVSVLVVDGEPVWDWAVEGFVNGPVQENPFDRSGTSTCCKVSFEIPLPVQQGYQDTVVGTEPVVHPLQALDSAVVADLVPALVSGDSNPRLHGAFHSRMTTQFNTRQPSMTNVCL